jgi:uncharacterized membrane protein
MEDRFVNKIKRGAGILILVLALAGAVCVFLAVKRVDQQMREDRLYAARMVARSLKRRKLALDSHARRY